MLEVLLPIVFFAILVGLKTTVVMERGGPGVCVVRRTEGSAEGARAYVLMHAHVYIHSTNIYIYI